VTDGGKPAPQQGVGNAPSYFFRRLDLDGISRVPEVVDVGWAQREMIGCRAVLLEGDVIGQVVGVVAESPKGIGHALLDIEGQLVPLVREIVPFFDAKSGLVYVDPPEGLLDLEPGGSSEGSHPRDSILDALDYVGSEVDAMHASGTTSLRPGYMPTHADLRRMGRDDLVAIVDAHGGHFDVAQCLGFLPTKRPPGYWDIDNLALEVEAFLEALWQCDDEQERDKVNVDGDGDGADGDANANGNGDANEDCVVERHALTGEVRTRPEEGDGGAGASQFLADRLLPSSTVLKKHGRWDLHHGITLNGGYKQVARDLDRVLFGRGVKSKTLVGDFDKLAKEVRAIMAEQGTGVMPSQSMLRKLARSVCTNWPLGFWVRQWFVSVRA